MKANSKRKVFGDAVDLLIIQLPSNLFFGTSISTCIMVLKKGKVDDKILFIDASKEFVKVTNNNRLTQENIQHIMDTYVQRTEIVHYAHVASHKEVVNNNYNLAVSTYVEEEDTREEIDIEDLENRIQDNGYGVGLGNDERDTVLRCASVDALGIPYIRIAPTCVYSCDYLCRVLNLCHNIGPPLFVLWYKSTESFRALHFHDSYVNSQSALSGYLLISVVVSNA